MPCFLGLIALFVPRVVIVLVWFFSNWFDSVFEGILIPILGFIFLPTTLLWYSVVINIYEGEWGLIQILVAIVAVLIDLSPAGGRRS